MPIQRTSTSERRVGFTPGQLEQLKNTQGIMNLMKRVNSEANPDMRGADSILFEPKLLIPGGAQKEPSSRRVQMADNMQFVYYAGGFIIFLVALKYLTN
mgnify:CR=1 FL=1